MGVTISSQPSTIALVTESGQLVGSLNIPAEMAPGISFLAVNFSSNSVNNENIISSFVIDITLTNSFGELITREHRWRFVLKVKKKEELVSVFSTQKLKNGFVRMNAWKM